eukprot:GHVH01010639.1.p2 GENE.GHVH01010639.1~~GHVH01010639.1.p2  ORF type:complete len:298 (+),score=66.80 GHVH01010639.1:1686-2579(+)
MCIPRPLVWTVAYFSNAFLSATAAETLLSDRLLNEDNSKSSILRSSASARLEGTDLNDLRRETKEKKSRLVEGVNEGAYQIDAALARIDALYDDSKGDLNEWVRSKKLLGQELAEEWMDYVDDQAFAEMIADKADMYDVEADVEIGNDELDLEEEYLNSMIKLQEDVEESGNAYVNLVQLVIDSESELVHNNTYAPVKAEQEIDPMDVFYDGLESTRDGRLGRVYEEEDDVISLPEFNLFDDASRVSPLSISRTRQKYQEDAHLSASAYPANEVEDGVNPTISAMSLSVIMIMVSSL